MCILYRATRSRMMAGIRGRDTKPERRVRSALHAAGFRYRLHVRTLPGRPDLVLPRFRAVIFVQGCFWHRHEGCPAATTPSSNARFWREKLELNVARDARNSLALQAAGWRVATIWECAVRRMSDDQIAIAVGHWLHDGASTFALPA